MVPVPKSSLMGNDDLWVPRNMAAALVEHGLGASVVPCLRRVSAVPKAAWSKPKDRPTARLHYETIAATAPLGAHGRLVLVDDVVTTGAVFMGAANRLSGAFPGAKIAAFAAMRTASFGDFKKIADPKLESITLYPSGKTFRK